MRTIKFRGYVPTYLGMKGYWVYGLLARYNDELATIVSNDKLYTVPSNTIGQFTGLHDKNGVEIYEGDVIHITRGLGNFADKKGQVIFTEGAFHIEGQGFTLSFASQYGLEVIGNIHEEVEE